MNSLHKRLCLGAGLAIAATLLVAGLAMFAGLRAALYHDLDANLLTTAQALAALTRETEQGVRFDLVEADWEEFRRTEHPDYFEVWLNGEVFSKSSQLGSDHLAWRSGTLHAPAYGFTNLPGGRAGRFISVTFPPAADFGHGTTPTTPPAANDEVGSSIVRATPWKVIEAANQPPLLNVGPGILSLVWQREEPQIRLVVARDTAAVDDRLALIRWLLGSFCLLATLLSIPPLMYVVRRALAPVHHLSRTIARIQAESLAQRLPRDGVPAEILPIVDRLNELLSRLEDAFRRERSFSANIAHELRTPLAGLSTTLEVYLSHPHEPTEYAEAMRACMKICGQSQQLVENLLSLARVEGAGFRRYPEEVHVPTVLAECWEELREHAEHKNLHLISQLEDEIVETDRSMLRMVVRNLLHNAVAHCDPGGRIEATSELDDDGTCLLLRIENTGSRLKPEELPHVFDRLWRGNRARSQTGEHFGLGLTICKSLVESLGGSIAATSHGSVFGICVRLPVSQDQPAPCSSPANSNGVVIGNQ